MSGPNRRSVLCRRRPRGRRCRQQTLVELLLAMTLGLALVAAAYGLVRRAAGVSREGVDDTWLRQDLLVVRRQWRDVVHACPSAGWRTEPGALVAGTVRAEVTPDALVFTRGTDVKRVALPRGVRARIGTDTTAGVRPAAVLNLTWDATLLGRRQPHSVRIVACPGAAAATAPGGATGGSGRTR